MGNLARGGAGRGLLTASEKNNSYSEAIERHINSGSGQAAPRLICCADEKARGLLSHFVFLLSVSPSRVADCVTYFCIAVKALLDLMVAWLRGKFGRQWGHSLFLFLRMHKLEAFLVFTAKVPFLEIKYGVRIRKTRAFPSVMYEGESESLCSFFLLVKLRL